jgi:DNA-binding transcriptional MerR regulator
VSEIQKSTFKIGEVCRFTDTQPYVLRFWESEFPQLTPSKNASGQRVYHQEDVDLILRIKQLLYDEEYTIAGARALLEDERKRRKAKRGKAARTSEPEPTAEAAEAAEPAVEFSEFDAPGFRSYPDTVDRERYENAVREIQRLRLDHTRLREERDEQVARAQDLERRGERAAKRIESLLDRVASSVRAET